MNDAKMGRKEHYGARAKQLGTLVQDAAQTGAALATAGSVLRRKTALAAQESSIDAALRALGPDAVTRWLSSVDLESVREQLLRATLEAVEAGLAEADEMSTWRAWALEALSARDELESALVALERWQALNPNHASRVGSPQRVVEGLGELDRSLSHRARWLVALNEGRRAELELLDTAARARAWWFQARVECDGLLAALAGGPLTDAHLSSCQECRADLEAARAVDTRRLRHLSDDDLWRFDSGLAGNGERAVVETHAAKCAECAQAVQLLDEGDAFIAEALGEPPQPVAPRRPPDDPQRARRREVLAEQKGFRLVLVREHRRTRLLVEQSSPAVARAEVQTGGAWLGASQTEEGLEVELPPSATGAAIVRVHLKGRASSISFPISL